MSDQVREYIVTEATPAPGQPARVAVLCDYHVDKLAARGDTLIPTNSTLHAESCVECTNDQALQQISYQPRG